MHYMKSYTLDVSIDKELAKKLFIVVNSLDRSSYSSRNEDLPQHWSEALGAYNEAVDYHDTIDYRSKERVAILCTTADASTVLQSNTKMNIQNACEAAFQDLISLLSDLISVW